MGHMLQDSIPAFSLQNRDVEQVFGKWVFNTTIQCSATTVDTAVCADVSSSGKAGTIKAVVPWLGGDFNPW